MLADARARTVGASLPRPKNVVGPELLKLLTHHHLTEEPRTDGYLSIRRCHPARDLCARIDAELIHDVADVGRDGALGDV